jgi:hypothetical protein
MSAGRIVEPALVLARRRARYLGLSRRPRPARKGADHPGFKPPTPRK